MVTYHSSSLFILIDLVVHISEWVLVGILALGETCTM